MKKLIFFLLPIILISCSVKIKGPGDFNLCVTKIQYHTSSNCDDSSKIASAFVGFEASPVIFNIEEILSEAEIGECVLVNLDGVFVDEGSTENLGSVYLVNDTDKTWLVNDCRE